MEDQASKNEDKTKAEQAAGVLYNAYKNCNDERMEQCLQKLSECIKARETAGAYLYQAVDYRPWDGQYYEPKSWRSDVKDAINRLYGSDELLGRLKDKSTDLMKVLAAELGEIFDEPLYVLGPVHDLKIEEEKYCFLFTDLLEVLVNIAKQTIEPGEMDIEVRLNYIRKIDERVTHLATLLKDEKKYGSYRGILGNAHRIREALNHD